MFSEENPKMALNLTAAEFALIRDDFLLIDEDGDGRLTRQEILKLVKDGKEDAMDFMMKLMDADDNGTVEFHEFLEIMAFLNFNKGLNKRTATQFFRALDKDGDGHLTVDELCDFYKMIGCASDSGPSREDIESLVKELDKDGDGKVDLKEFISGIDRF